MSRAMHLRLADSEAAETKSWTCKTCDTMVEADGEHCRSCAAYWADCASGLFDDDYELDLSLATPSHKA